MSWSRRSVIAAALAASACGFEPALAPGGGAEGLRGAFEFSTPANRIGFALRRRLEERLGLPAGPAYELRTRLVLGSDVTGIPADRVTARTNLVGEITYDVVDLNTDEVLRRGQVQGFTGFSSTSTTVATRTARTDAYERLMALLADRIAAELIATAPEWRR